MAITLNDLLKLKRVAVDTSSLIYCLKVGILGMLAARVRLETVQPVLEELRWPKGALPVHTHPVLSREGSGEAPSVDALLLQWAVSEQLPLLSEDRELLEEADNAGLAVYRTGMMLELLVLRNRTVREEYPEYLSRLRDVAGYNETTYRELDELHRTILRKIDPA